MSGVQRTCICIISIVISFNSVAQKRNNWWCCSDWFDTQWLNFGDSNPPAVVPLFYTGSAAGSVGSISDISGNLLIYNEFLGSYNSLGQAIGGASMLWDPNLNLKGSLIIPSHSGGRYGVFLTGKISLGTLDGGYYEVDIVANGGLGAVLAPGALILENDVLSEIAATPHANGQDYWIAFHADDSNTWYMYRYGPAGLDAVPVISQTGIDLIPDVAIDSQIKFSYAGNKLAFQTKKDTIDLFEFDDASGVVQHFVSLPTPLSNYGLEFSMSGQYLYMVNSSADTSSVYQWDVELPPLQIAGSRTTVYSSITPNGGYNVGMLLAPDGRIYFPHDVTPYYSRIDYPDLQGVACTVVEDVIGSAPAELLPFVNNHCKRYHDSEFAVGIDEAARPATPELWPNPMRDNGWLYLPGHNGQLQLIWHDAMGRTIRAEEKTVNGGRLALDVTDLEAGHYSIQVIGTKQTVARVHLVVE